MTRFNPPGYYECEDGLSASSATGSPQSHATTLNRKSHQWQLDLQRATSNPDLRAAAASSSSFTSDNSYDFDGASTVFSAFALDDNIVRGMSAQADNGTKNPFTALNDAKQRAASQQDEEPPAYEDGGHAKIISKGLDKKPTTALPVAFHCQRCKEAVKSSDRIAQIPSCDHIVCVQCLSFHIVKELGSSRYPVECPVCINAGTQKDLRGVVNASVAETCSLPPLALEAFHDFQLSQHSTRVTCPQCLNSMLLEREEYMKETVIVCPLPDCGHRWCKQCQKQMPTSPVQVAKHACKPCDGRVCPGCGALGKRAVTSNNHVKCREIGCGMHYCYGCGDPIGQEGITPNLDGAIVAHLKQCGSKKYCVIM
ncbi:hypothetical protein BKA70DRAFT_476468 [Coprinopsis sp. MPI-PUGE-AT-0042]|nr:hypothetical protein BKA70DRAFT_476468 [Coprinopsis sp. MPI-PUGE-AT-0042]